MPLLDGQTGMPRPSLPWRSKLRVKGVVLIIALLLIVVGVIGFQTGAYYEFQRLFMLDHPASLNSGNHTNSTSRSHSNSTSNANSIEVNTIINYGNSTSAWFNQTKVPLGWTFYNLTLMIANGRVDGYYDSSLKEHYISGINGVEQNLPNYWALWTFCDAKNAWMYSNVGADGLILSNNRTYGWYYSTGSSAPVQGASITTSC